MAGPSEDPPGQCSASDLWPPKAGVDPGLAGPHLPGLSELGWGDGRAEGGSAHGVGEPCSAWAPGFPPMSLGRPPVDPPTTSTTHGHPGQPWRKIPGLPAATCFMSPPHAHAQAHTHTSRHTCTHVHAHACHTHGGTCIHTHTCACVRTPAPTYTHSCIHAHSYAYARTCMHTHNTCICLFPLPPERTSKSLLCLLLYPGSRALATTGARGFRFIR